MLVLYIGRSHSHPYEFCVFPRAEVCDDGSTSTCPETLNQTICLQASKFKYLYTSCITYFCSWQDYEDTKFARVQIFESAREGG